jgi:Xaa-Pro aminopeptidase
MIRDTARVERITRSLKEADLDAVVGSTPAHVLMLTGYWPVVGNAMAIVNRDGQVAIIAPEDERELAEEAGPTSCTPSCRSRRAS